MRTFGGALALALVHNGLLAVLLALVNATRSPTLITALWLGAALYTALVATAWSLVKSG
jgi:hypothetical protein